MMECHVSVLGHCNLDIISRINLSGEYPSILFEVGIPNFVYGCIFGWSYVAYHFWVTVILTYDLVSRIIVSGAYLLYYLRLEFQNWCGFILGWRSGAYYLGSQFT